MRDVFGVTEQMTEKFILDTDIGADCDDMGAIVLLASLSKKYRKEICGIACCVYREYAAACAQLVVDEYLPRIPVAALPKGEFAQKDNYAEAVVKKFGGKKQRGIDYYDFYQETLRSAEDQSLTIIAIGPLYGLGQVYRKNSLDFDRKVKSVFIMGGYFGEDNAFYEGYGNIHSEWNIGSAINEAKFFIDNVKAELCFCPFEVGIRFKTGINLIRKGGPAGYSYWFLEKGERFSWDPATVSAAFETDPFFRFSAFGTVHVDSEGFTRFKEGNGKHRIVLPEEKSILSLREYLNELMK